VLFEGGRLRQLLGAGLLGGAGVVLTKALDDVGEEGRRESGKEGWFGGEEEIRKRMLSEMAKQRGGKGGREGGREGRMRRKTNRGAFIPSHMQRLGPLFLSVALERGKKEKMEGETHPTLSGGLYKRRIGSSISIGVISKRLRTCSAKPRVTSASARQERESHIFRTRMALSRRILPATYSFSKECVCMAAKGWGWRGGGEEGEGRQ